MALDNFIPQTPERQDPVETAGEKMTREHREKEKKLDDKTKDLIAKEKQFSNKLALNKSPVVQQFLKTWYQINVDQKNHRQDYFKEEGDFSIIRDNIRSQNLFKDSVSFSVLEKDPKTLKISHWSGNKSYPSGINTGMSYDLGTHKYSSRYEVNEAGIMGMKLIYVREDWRGVNEDLNKDGEDNDYLSKNSGVVILVDKNGGANFYKNPLDGKYSQRDYDLESDISKMEKLELTDQDKLALMKEFTLNYQQRKQLHKEKQQQDSERKKKREIEISKKAVQSAKKVL